MFFSVSHIDKLLFTRELSILMKSGVSLGEALESLEEKSGKGRMAKVIRSLIQDVDNGQILSRALARFPKVFDDLYINLVQIGEASGTLTENLEFLSQQLDNSFVLRKKIQGILLYPSIVLSMALILSAGISIFILPRLTKLFSAFNVDLPLSTRALLSLASFMESYGVIFFIGLFSLFVGFRILIALSLFKAPWHRFLLSLPGLGSFFQDVAIAHFCRDMGIMLQSGLPILEALQVEERVMNNRALARLIGDLAEATAQGRSLSEELSRKHYKLISLLAVKMIAAGEKTGNLSDTFLYLESFYKSEVDRRIKNMTVLFEPVLLLVIGVIVVFLALAILTPIYSLTGSVRR